MSKKSSAVRLGRAASLTGVVGAGALALFVNVFGARHFKRWDWTMDQRYTLSTATIETLHTLPETAHVWVLMGGGEPLLVSLKQLLTSYQSESSRIELHFIDPDKEPLAYLDVKKRFKVDSGRAADGVVVADALVVVSMGDKHWFVSPHDMIEVADETDPRAKPREEKAITGALRRVMGGERAKLCFTAGHGEQSLSQTGATGLSVLRDVLEKDNYEVTTVDTTLPNALEPFKGCAAVVIAGARESFKSEEENRLRTYLLEGGNLLACLSPINAETDTGMKPVGLARAVTPFGIGLEDALVFETDPNLVFPNTGNIRFVATPKPHAVTAALVLSDKPNRLIPRVVSHFTRPLAAVSEAGAPKATEILATSSLSYARKSIVGASEWQSAPPKEATDLSGPIVIGMASERPKLSPSASHGPRAVVIGTGSAMLDDNWRVDAIGRGMALLVESSISWLTSKPQVLDVPDKASVQAGIRITEESRSEIQRYVLVFMPAAALLLGAAVWFRRRSTEGTARKSKNGDKKTDAS